MMSSPFRLWFSILIFCAVAMFFVLEEIPDTRLHLYFLDVGQGDSVFIKTPENHQILVDGGDGERLMEELGDVMPFFDRSIDMVVVTHPHADHIGGLVEVLQRYEVGMVLMTGVNNQNVLYNQFLDEMITREIDFIIADQFTDFRFGEVEFDVLYPVKQMLLEDIENLNNSSIVMKIVAPNLTLLLTGDSEIEVEELLLDRHVDLSADVLKVGHHGSTTSSSYEFLLEVMPETAVIQVGKDNSFGHPHEKTLQNLKALGVEKIHRTDLDGRVELVF